MGISRCIRTTGPIAGFILATLVASVSVPAYALEGSMGPPRMTLRTEIPFMSQFMSQGAGVIEVPIRVLNTANEPESVRLFTTDDLNNRGIMEVEFTEEQFVLKPKEQKVINVTFEVKRPGTYSGNIVTLFNSAGEQSDSALGSTVGLRLNSKVSIVAESKGPNLSFASIGALGFASAGIALLILMVLMGIRSSKRKKRRGEEKENG